MGHKFTALIQFESKKDTPEPDLAQRSATLIVKNWLAGRGLPEWVNITGSGIVNLQSITVAKRNLKRPQRELRVPFTEDFVGLAEVAEMANVSKSVVSNWRKRKEHFPPPLIELAQGPVWLRGNIDFWLDEFGLRKGGTGKKARNDASN